MLQSSQLAGNLLWNGGIDLSIVYSGKAIAHMQAIIVAGYQAGCYCTANFLVTAHISSYP